MGDDFVVKIVNFQRIRKALLTFSPGLNVIVGESNNGKTNIYRSLNALLFNSSRDSYVTLGESKAAVGVKYRGHEVIWRRDNKAASPTTYRVDGKIYSKIGRGVLPSVAEVLGIREVELDDMKIRLNFQRQMEYPFLLDKTPSQLFKFIMQSAEEDNVMQVIKNMKKDLAQMGANIRAYEDTREELRRLFEREADRYRVKRNAIPYCDAVIALENKVKKYERLEEIINSIKGYVERVSVLERNLVLVSKRLAVLEEVISSVEPKIGAMIKLANVMERYSEGFNMVCGLKKDLDKINIKLDKFESLDDIDLEKVEVLKRGYLELQTFISKLNSTRDNLNNKINSYIEVNRKLHEVETELSSFEVCPYCGSKL